MNKKTKPEVWQRGPAEGVPALLQPVAHALLQVGEEAGELLEDFPFQLLWIKPAGLASAAFHLQHISGVIDRLFTYARKESLSEQQLQWLAAEGRHSDSITKEILIAHLHDTIEQAINQLKKTDEIELTQFRGIGRAQIPTTLMGLLFHAAEHSMRHMGQLLVTVHIVSSTVI
jgi:hypothetical protein